MRRFLVLSIAVVAMAVMAASASAEMIDDFTSDTLDAAWVQSTVLNFGAGGSPTFDTTTNDDQLTITGVGAGNQEVLLRADRGLGVGEILLTDFVSMSLISGDNPTAGLCIATATGIEVRSDMLTCVASTVVRDTNPEWIQCIHWNGTSEVWGGRIYVDFDNVAKLYISRTGETTYDVGYVDTFGVYQSADNVTHTSGNNPGDAIGYYADMRTLEETVFDNFAVIPEPSTVMLLLIGGLALFSLRLRSKN